MIRTKTWKQRMFASVVAVCMIFTLLPATAMATDTPATPLVQKVWIGNDNPSTMQDKTDELAGYKANMAQVKKVVYSKSANKITVVANVEGMTAYMPEGDELEGQKLYTLVMDFESGKDITHATGSHYGIEEIDKTDGDKFVPEGVEAINPIVFWLDAGTSETNVVLKDKDDETKTQTFTIEVVSPEKLVQNVWKGNDNPNTMASKPDELTAYKENMAAVEDVAYNDTENVITVTADTSKMTAYMPSDHPLKGQKLYTLVMDFGETTKANISAVGSYGIEDVDKTDGDKFLTGQEADNPIVFWLDAATEETNFVLIDNETKHAQEITVKVVAPTPEPEPVVTTVEAVKVNKAATELTVGGTEKLTAEVTVSPADATEPVPTWNSSNDKVAKVAADGTVTAIAAGTANITATATIGDSAKTSDPCVVTVKNANTTTTNNNTTAGNNTTTNTAPKVGEKKVIAGITYQVAKNNTVTYQKPKKNAKKVTVPATVKINGKTYKVTAIAKNAFKGNKKVKTVKVGKNVTTIGASAFQNCKALSTVTLPAKTATIGKNAFANSKKLKKIVIKSTKMTKKTVKNGAFKGVSKKATIDVPNKKAKTYKKLFQKKGLPKACKVK